MEIFNLDLLVRMRKYEGCNREGIARMNRKVEALAKVIDGSERGRFKR